MMIKRINILIVLIVLLSCNSTKNEEIQNFDLYIGKFKHSIKNDFKLFKSLCDSEIQDDSTGCFFYNKNDFHTFNFKLVLLLIDCGFEKGSNDKIMKTIPKKINGSYYILVFKNYGKGWLFKGIYDVSRVVDIQNNSEGKL